MKKLNLKKKVLKYIEDIKKNPLLVLYVFGNFFNALLLKLFT